MYSLDDGRTKPDPRPGGPPAPGSCKGAPRKPRTASSSSSSTKTRLDSTSSEGGGGPDYMCLIRATYRQEKISTVVRAY